ncbi:AarF/ABC1/UbiB kinase family protein [Microbacterium limosum]|uniref:AarF/ABC1/UbiB kinase family protein n=1 Tax=Microbacterium limosum TaxID=3079935 RepID=A0AAU0MH99_9MICO|nr:AarF/ABC1/UbiB kinase family protein [Microbacterium sp. Y20]WOQ69863.1 AarF/ABC1/UbiB kinase family protein [Microbacterium sp. Y20]
MTANRSRYRQIGAVLRRHGLGVLAGVLGLGGWVPFHRGALGHARQEDPYTNPEHVRVALEELGPTFVKLGQILSTRHDLLPEAWVAEFTKLQDNVASAPWEGIRDVLRDELGADPEQVFARFDPVPLAAASIGQAYAATLHDGTEVVVKVRRPGVVAQVHEDLDILRNLADRAERRWDAVRQYDLPGLVEEFSRTLRGELDYLQEARNAERFAENFAASTQVRIPRVYANTTTSRVLTLERMSGVRIDDLEGLDAAGIDRTALARLGADLVLTMVFDHRFFHADPHPGNMFVQPDGALALIDFGMVGELTEQTTDNLAGIVLAFTRDDPDALTTALTELSRTTDIVDRAGLRQAITAFTARYRGRSLSEISLATMLQQLLGILQHHQLHLPQETALLFKVLMMAEGTAAGLDPDFQMLDALQPYAEHLTRAQLSLPALARRWARAGADTGALLTELPATLRRLRHLLEDGGFEVHLRAAELEPLVGRAERVGNRVVAGMIAAALIGGIGTLVGGNTKWRSREGVLIGAGTGTIGALGGYLLWTLRRRRPRPHR